MAKKPKHHKDEEVNNEFAAEAEQQGDITHEEAVEASHSEAKKGDDGEVKKPVLQGHDKKDYGKPKYGSTVNSKTEDIGKPKSDEE